MSQPRWWPAGGLSAALTNELLVVVTLILSMLIFLFFFHHLRAKLYRHAATTAAPPRRNRRIRILLAPNYAHSAQQGLGVEAIRALPATSFRLQDFEDGLECAICLSEPLEGEKVRVLSGCGHGFHADCIDMWLYSRNTCPVCRSVVDAPPVGAHGAPPTAAAASSGRGGMLVIDIPGVPSGAEDEGVAVRGSVRVIARAPFVM